MQDHDVWTSPTAERKFTKKGTPFSSQCKPHKRWYYYHMLIKSSIANSTSKEEAMPHKRFMKLIFYYRRKH